MPYLTEVVGKTIIHLETDYGYRNRPVLRFTVGDDSRPFFSIRGMIAHYPKVGNEILEACQEIFEYGLPEPYGEKMMLAIENAKKPF